MAGEETTAGASRAATVARKKGRRWRGVLAQVAPLLAGAVLLILGALLVNGTGRARATATSPPSPEVVRADRPAPGFRLRDQSGAEVTLESLRGKVVALTFLYSSCPDVCPVTLGKFGLTRDRLGPQADEVAFLAITVDPERDNPGRLRQFLAAQGLEAKVLFLTGDRADLARVWSDYGITIVRGPGVADTADGGYEAIHSDRIYLIDQSGCLRDVLRSTAAPQELLLALAGMLGDRSATAGGTCG